MEKVMEIQQNFNKKLNDQSFDEAYGSLNEASKKC